MRATPLVAAVANGWSFAVRCPTRGRFDLGTLHVRLWDRSGMAVRESRHALPQPILVFPHVAIIRQVPRPVRTRFSFGNYISPRLGEGIEPGEIRPFLPGDRTRHINWRASLRRQQLYVTQYQEERNADIVLLLDALSDIGAAPYSTLDFSVRAAAALAHTYVARKDRVGLLEFGGYLRRINPASEPGLTFSTALLPLASRTMGGGRAASISIIGIGSVVATAMLTMIRSPSATRTDETCCRSSNRGEPVRLPAPSSPTASGMAATKSSARSTSTPSSSSDATTPVNASTKH
jgi:hypothetical protein